jgi:hypothetical protein
MFQYFFLQYLLVLRFCQQNMAPEKCIEQTHLFAPQKSFFAF